MAPFFPTACQNFTAIYRRHAFSETMNTFTAALMRLVSTFFSWHYLMFFLLVKIVSVIISRAPSLLFCERAAKVRKDFKFWSPGTTNFYNYRNFMFYQKESRFYTVTSCGGFSNISHE